MKKALLLLAFLQLLAAVPGAVHAQQAQPPVKKFGIHEERRAFIPRHERRYLHRHHHPGQVRPAHPHHHPERRMNRPMR